MSFGCSVGDIITTLQFVNNIRHCFQKAPEQFRAISDQVEILHDVLDEVRKVIEEVGLDDEQGAALQKIMSNFQDSLAKLQDTLQRCGLDLASDTVKGKFQRTWRRLRWDQTEITEFRSQIAITIKSLTLLLNSYTLSAVRTSRIPSDQQANDQRRKDVLDWLTPPDHGIRESDWFDVKKQGTGQWFLDSNEFQEWVGNHGRKLFCTGIPGSGKTILTSVAINYLKQQFKGNNGIGIASLYCSFDTRQENGNTDLFALVLKQLVRAQRDIPESIKELYEHHTMKLSKPSFEDLSNEIHNLSTCFSRVFIVIDALDEYKDSGMDCRRLLSALSKLQTQTGANILITSRPLLEIEYLVGDCSRIEIYAHVDDIRRYLDERMSSLSMIVQRDVSLQEEIKSTIVKAADGMFLLAQLHMDSLEGKTTKKYIRQQLQSFLKEIEISGNKRLSILNSAYMQAMERISAQGQDLEDLALQVIAWTTCAKRPLTPLELQTALAIELGSCELDAQNMTDIEDLISVCAGLVTVDKASNTIQLVHYTTREFFQQTWTMWFPRAQEDIAQACVTYLSFDAFKTGPCRTVLEIVARVSSYPFYHYAAQYWGYHASTVSDETQRLILGFLENDAQTSSSSQEILAPANQTSRHLTSGHCMVGTHLAAFFGLEWALSALLANGLNPESKDGHDRTPLSWAAERGHEGVVRLLLENKNVDAESKSCLGQTSLSVAARFGHPAIVSLLADTGHADVNSRSHSGLTPLLFAVLYGHESTVRLLLATKGIDLNSEDPEDGRTALSWAAGAGHEGIAQLLIETGSVELDAKDTSYLRTPLSWAADNGHETIVRLLLNTKLVSLDSPSRSGLIPLSWASRYGHHEIVRMLLAENNDTINSRDNNGWTPLSWAAEGGHTAVVQFLLQQRDIDPDAPSNSGRTPLSLAASRGHKDIAEMLLRQPRVDVNRQDNIGDTAMLHAAASGHLSIVELLLEQEGVDPDLPNKDNWTPFMWAADNGHTAVVELLLQRKDVKINAQNDVERTPLSQASGQGWKDVVELVLERSDVNLDLQDRDGRTALDWAVLKGKDSVYELLLKKYVSGEDDSPESGSEDTAEFYPAPKVTHQALDFYSMWSAESTNAVVITEPEAGHCYLSSPPIGELAVTGEHPVRKVTFVITSHDQGWSDIPVFHGTYDHSYTWFEAVARDDNGENSAGLSRTVLTNIHGSKNFTTHSITWRFNAEDEGERMWVRSLRRGQHIDLTVWARFRGWKNYVQSAKMEITTVNMG